MVHAVFDHLYCTSIIGWIERAPETSLFVSIACQSFPVAPSCSRDTTSFFYITINLLGKLTVDTEYGSEQGLEKKCDYLGAVWYTSISFWFFWYPADPVGYATCTEGAHETSYMAELSNFRQLHPTDSISNPHTSTKLGSQETFSTLREMSYFDRRFQREVYRTLVIVHQCFLCQALRWFLLSLNIENGFEMPCSFSFVHWYMCSAWHLNKSYFGLWRSLLTSSKSSCESSWGHWTFLKAHRTSDATKDEPLVLWRTDL